MPHYLPLNILRSKLLLGGLRSAVPGFRQMRNRTAGHLSPASSFVNSHGRATTGGACSAIQHSAEYLGSTVLSRVQLSDSLENLFL